MFVLAGETYQRVQMFVENGFESDWNLSYPAGYGQLLNTSANCLAMPYWYHQPNCQGYSQSNIISNWLGAGGFDNSWSDSTNFTNLSNPTLQTFNNFVLSQTSGKHMSLINNSSPASPVDFPVSSSNTNIQKSPQIAMSGNYGLITWESNDLGYPAIRGRILDLISGNTIGLGDLLINCIPNGPKLQKVAAFGGIALVVWQSGGLGNNDINGHTLNLSSGQVINYPYDLQISSSNANDQINPEMSVSNIGKALIVWSSNDNITNSYDIRGRIFDFYSGTLSTADILISSTNLNSQSYPKLAVSGTKALVVWQSNDNLTNSYDIRGRVVDISTGAVVGATDFLISSNNAFDQASPEVAVSDTKALVTWVSQNINMGPYDIRGRIVDISTGAIVGVNDFTISTNNTNNQQYQKLAINNNRALVTWTSNDAAANDYNIRGRLIDMFNGLPLGISDFLISSSNNNQQSDVQLAINNTRAFVTWFSNDSLSNFVFSDIRGREVDLFTGMPVGPEDILISSTRYLIKLNSQLLISNGKALVTWAIDDSNMGNTNIIAAFVNLDSIYSLPYGLNHFFTSPLIERNYTVTTRLKY